MMSLSEGRCLASALDSWRAGHCIYRGHTLHCFRSGMVLVRAWKARRSALGLKAGRGLHSAVVLLQPRGGFLYIVWTHFRWAISMQSDISIFRPIISCISDAQID